MRAIFLVAGAALLSAQVSTAQVHIRREVPYGFARVPTDEGQMRRRVSDVLRRDIHTSCECEDFVRDLTALGRGAVPQLIGSAGGANDRHVTEALLRLGGPEVRVWVEGVLDGENSHRRHALLAGIRSAERIDGTVRLPLTRLLHDQSPEVRILAVDRLHTIAPVHELLTRGHDMNREVARAAILTMSRRWVFLDHGSAELQNLQRFVGLLEIHRRDDDWSVGRGFLFAFQKDRIADTKLGRELRARTKRLPWFSDAGDSLSSNQLTSVRTELRKRTDRRDEFLAMTLKKMRPEAGAELLLVLAEDRDAEIRLAACRAGLTLLDPELAASFVRFLKDPDVKVRAEARALLDETGFYADQKLRWGGGRRL